MDQRFASWGWSWVALTAAFALHVIDEAVNDFLAVYNPTVLAIRGRLPLLPLPTFTFAVWLTGLILAVIILFCMSPLAFRGARALRFVAYAYAVIMFLNGVQHIIGSLYMRALMPGALSAPVLLVASVALLMSTKRAVMPPAQP